MLTAEEIQALIQLVNRIPLTQAEALWIREILTRLSQEGLDEKEAMEDIEAVED